jgi:multicomponent Na+:H+ antiporter subunit E
MTTDAAGGRRRHEPEEFSRWEAVWRQLPLLLGLVALWVFLWDHVDVLTVTTGVLLAIAVTRALYLPPVLLSGRFNPWRGLLLGLRMMFDVVVASIQVASKAIWPTWQPMNAIIHVQLLTRSDLVTTLTAEAISVVPGTVVVDIDRERGLLYLHALGTRTPEDLDDVRERVLATEERIVLAIGTRAQARAVHEARRRRRVGETGRIEPGLAREVAPSQTAARHPLAEHDVAAQQRDDSGDHAEGHDHDDRNGGMP